jgi:hypothetical protein
MLRSYRPFFLPLTLTLVLGVSNCKTANQASEPNTEFHSIENVPKVQVETLSTIVVSKHNQARPELRQVFPKLSMLQNLTGKQVHALLGVPSFKRSDSPAEVWQYQNYSCTLDLFLYENLDTAVSSVVHFEIRLQPDQVLTKNECFGIVIKASSQTS